MNYTLNSEAIKPNTIKKVLQMNILKMVKICVATGAVLLSSMVFAGKPVDINTAPAALIASSLDGVGPVKSAAIVAYREANGPFKTVADIDKVRGIGTKTLERNKDFFVGIAK